MTSSTRSLVFLDDWNELLGVLRLGKGSSLSVSVDTPARALVKVPSLACWSSKSSGQNLQVFLVVRKEFEGLDDGHRG